MKRLFLVRHGETDWNKQGIFRGVADVPLNDTGLGQAKALGRYFSGIPLKAIYTSKLARTLDTAGGIARRQPGGVSLVQTDDGLLEINRGDWQGLTLAQVKEKFPESYAKWFRDAEKVHFPGGESLGVVQRRAMRSFERISREEGDIALVSHHVVLRTLLCGILGLGLSRFRQFELHPASVSELRLEYDAWVVHRLNDVCHLGRGG